MIHCHVSQLAMHTVQNIVQLLAKICILAMVVCENILNFLQQMLAKRVSMKRKRLKSCGLVSIAWLA